MTLCSQTEWLRKKAGDPFEMGQCSLLKCLNRGKNQERKEVILWKIRNEKQIVEPREDSQFIERHHAWLSTQLNAGKRRGAKGTRV